MTSITEAKAAATAIAANPAGYNEKSLAVARALLSLTSAAMDEKLSRAMCEILRVDRPLSREFRESVALEIERLRALTPPPASGDREALAREVALLIANNMDCRRGLTCAVTGDCACAKTADAILAAGFKRGG